MEAECAFDVDPALAWARNSAPRGSEFTEVVSREPNRHRVGVTDAHVANARSIRAVGPVEDVRDSSYWSCDRTTADIGDVLPIVRVLVTVHVR